MPPKFNVDKLRAQFAKHNNKGKKSTSSKFSNVSPFCQLKEGTNYLRLVPWPDAEEDEDGLKIPEFKELQFYYNLKYPNRDENGKIIEKWGKPDWNKAPIVNRSRGLDDCVAEAAFALFSKTDEDGNEKTEEQLAEDKEMGKLLLPSTDRYLLVLNRDCEDEGLKLLSVRGSQMYEAIMTMLLDERKGPMIMDTSEDGHDLEITITMNEKSGRRNPPQISVDFDKKPLHEDEDKMEELLTSMDFPNPEKIFAKRYKTPEQLQEHFEGWLNSRAGEDAKPQEKAPVASDDVQEEVEEKPKRAKKKAVKKVVEVEVEEDEEEEEEVVAKPKKKAVKAKSADVADLNVDDAFSTLLEEDDED